MDAMSLPSSDNDQEDKGTEGKGEDARRTGGQGDIRTEGEASTTSSDATHHVGAAHSNEPTGPVKRRGTAENGSGASDEPVSKRGKGKSRPQNDVSPAAGTGLPDKRSLPDDVRVRMKSKIKLYNYRGDGSRTFAWKKGFRNHKVGLHDEAWGGMFSTYKIEPLLAEVWGLVGADWERYVETQDEEEHEG